MSETNGRQRRKIYAFTPRIAATLKNDGSAALAHVLAQTDRRQMRQVYKSSSSSARTLQSQRTATETAPFVEIIRVAHLDRLQRRRALDFTRCEVREGSVTNLQFSQLRTVIHVEWTVALSEAALTDYDSL